MRGGRSPEGGSVRACADMVRTPPPERHGYRVHGKATREAISPRKSKPGRKTGEDRGDVGKSDARNHVWFRLVADELYFKI